MKLVFKQQNLQMVGIKLNTYLSNFHQLEVVGRGSVGWNLKKITLGVGHVKPLLILPRNGAETMKHTIMLYVFLTNIGSGNLGLLSMVF